MYKVALCVSGGIAAYKTLSLLSMLVKNKFEVKVLMTKEALNFVGAESFKALSSNEVYIDVIGNYKYGGINHIELAKWADIFVVAPATANTIAKLRAGMADNMINASILATKAKKLIVPGMNTNMYLNEITQENIEYLKLKGFEVMDTKEGRLACGDVGKGKMPAAEEIFEKIDYILSKKDLVGLKIVVSASRTTEKIDPVRIFTNRSSGKMGFEIAKAASRRGAATVLVAGENNLDIPENVKYISVESTEDMKVAIESEMESGDALIMAAAPLDYKIKEYRKSKIKKDDANLVLEFERTVDILKEMGLKKDKKVLIGFAAESDNIIGNAKKKLREKNLDMVVANDITLEDSGFKSECLKSYFVYEDKVIENINEKKSILSDKILDEAKKIIEKRRG